MSIKIGILFVNMALVMYSIGILSEQRKKVITNHILFFITLGIIFDIMATTIMIISSSKGILTLHGALGYSALWIMIIDWIWMYTFRKRNSSSTAVSQKLHIFSRIAYVWWVLAYITGAILIALRHAH